MKKLAACLFVLTFCLSVCSCGARAEAPHGPLTQSELLALVAGAALPENIVVDIRERGLSFAVDATYRALMQKAGADTRVLAALDSAKVAANKDTKEAANPEVLEHLASAGKFMNDGNYPEAAKELKAVYAADSDSPEGGFVMGQLLRQQQRWGEAAAVYAQVLRQDPNFPETHTKLSYLYYRMDEQEDALREAKSALALTPDNAEAHKNAGISLRGHAKIRCRAGGVQRSAAPQARL